MQTVSLALSKQLYEKGLRVVTEKKWSNWYYGVLTFGKPPELFKGEYRLVEISTYIDDSEIPAYQTDELLAAMPDMFSIIRLPKNYGVKDMDGKYAILTRGGKAETWDYNPAEALSKMCLWLLSNGYCYNPKTKMIEAKNDKRT